MTPHLLALLTTVSMVLSTMLRRVIREEVRAALGEQRVGDRQVAHAFGIGVKLWRRIHEAYPDLRKAAGILIYVPGGGAARWRWRIADVEHYLREQQTDMTSLWKAAREKARKGEGARS